MACCDWTCDNCGNIEISNFRPSSPCELCGGIKWTCVGFDEDYEDKEVNQDNAYSRWLGI